jgi:hypothetical protein
MTTPQQPGAQRLIERVKPVLPWMLEMVRSAVQRPVHELLSLIEAIAEMEGKKPEARLEAITYVSALFRHGDVDAARQFANDFLIGRCKGPEPGWRKKLGPDPV